GLKLVLRDADVYAPTGPAGSLPGGPPSDLKPAFTSVREIAQIGYSERVLSYGIGLSSSRCVRVLQLHNPSRLVVDVATSGGPSACGCSSTVREAPTVTPAASTSRPFFPCSRRSSSSAFSRRSWAGALACPGHHASARWS